ncbi:MAG: DUF4149 domain-containing protein, partial [Nitrospinaceae bacterium]|nr:DUF4149 domain-containing protein [Nitrospinaceae bacterium]NIR56857.1 DUF4149 domain-containing protein [Nitrospinaceae bacterium]NIS87323.1 DUF4149 domain-containing protein [Nitrospinaceae bacterium]NIT84177.1 DUF4149 domain-containing protein [Nitrospinaceae bacterium]NIU46363.1 DUF4149 domain-containing protein [Nitrospinaceae bacterium]
RALFPVYYKVMGGCTLLAGGLLWNTPEAWALAAVVLLFLGAAIGLMPRINRYRDAQLAGDSSAAGPFQRLHRLSVVVN